MAMVRALWAIDCLYILWPPGAPPPRAPPRPAPGPPLPPPPAPPPYRLGRSSAKRAILETHRSNRENPSGCQWKRRGDASQQARFIQTSAGVRWKDEEQGGLTGKRAPCILSICSSPKVQMRQSTLLIRL